MPKPRRAELERWIARVEPEIEPPGGVVGEKILAERALHDAELEKEELQRRLQKLRAEIGATFSERSQRELLPYFDGWAPRELPLLPSPIHHQLLTADELEGKAGELKSKSDEERADLRALPPPGTMPDLGYLPAWKRAFASLVGRLLLFLGGFLSLPQRTLNSRLIERLEQLEDRIHELAHERDHLKGCLALLGERSIANFEFLDQCDRDRLVQLHQKAEELRSEWRGDLERLAERLESELAGQLELKTPGHRLALLEMEYALAEMKSRLAAQSLLLAELQPTEKSA